jgi:hypothetical protein
MARPRNTVRDGHGREVFGLSFTWDKQARKHRFYITATKPTKWLGYDKNTAIQRYLAIKSREVKEQIAVGPDSDAHEHLHDKKREQVRDDRGFLDTILAAKPRPGANGTKMVDAAWFYSRMRDALVNDPKECARRTGIKELAYLYRLEKPQPSVPVAECINIYLGRTRKVSEAEKHNLSYAWTMLQACCDTRYMSDVTEDSIAAWEQALAQTGWADATTRNTIARVKSIIRHCAKRHADCHRVLSLLEVVDMPSMPAHDPKPIPVDDYTALLDSADAQWKAILLVAMNCCYYAVDCWTLPASAVRDDEIVFRRAKTKVARAAWLWLRTRDALAALPCRNGDTVFTAAHKGAYKPGGFRAAYRRLKKKAGVKSTFDMIRDGAYTAAVRGAPIDQAKMVAGHSTGMSDAYVLRGGVLVREACAAVENQYFGSTDDAGSSRSLADDPLLTAALVDVLP